MYYDTKTMNKLINAYIKESMASNYNNRDTENKDVLIALLDYLLDRSAGYRCIAGINKMTKTRFATLVHTMPIRFNNKLAQKIYKKVICNRVQDYKTKILSEGEAESLENARAKLKKKSTQAFNNMSLKDIDKLLWHSV